MKKLSLTDFVDIVTKSGSTKATAVAKVKNRPPYSPATDFYKGIREKMAETIEQNQDKSNIDKAVDSATEKRKKHYEEAAKGFKKWCGRKQIEGFTPPKGTFGNSNVAVNVNPEIGAVINGVPHLIKLYFKTDKLPKNHALVSTHLMKNCLESECPEGTVMSVLDVKRGNLMEYTSPNDKLESALKGELAYIATLWENI